MVRISTAVRTLILGGLALTTLAFAKTDKSKTIVTTPSGFAYSQRVSDLPIDEPRFEGEQVHEPGPGPLRFKKDSGPAGAEDPVLQKAYGPPVAVTQGIDFNGIPSPGYVPSDSNLAVGPNDIVEVVNVQFAVYSKTGTTLAGPTNILSLFSPLGGVCTDTFGDPIVLYDRAADRWLISIIGSPNGSDASECVAVSQTNNPAGAYYLYGYSFGANLNDYPKLSTWATASNGAYLATYNIFQNFSNFIGADICGFDRTKMLAGNSTAKQLCVMTPSDEFGYLPSDMDGPTPPVDGTPGLFITWQNNSPGQLYLRKLTLNFASSTATLSSPTTISVANDTLACGDGGQCVPQQGTSQTLDTLGDRMMYRFAIRHFADHDRAVVNHAVANGSSVAVRWYELYDPAGSVTLNQQGTFAPDATFRWMASLAEDQNQDIGLGFSTASSSLNPGIRFTGRVPGDPLGTMESEATILTGTGSQTGSDRWGDYTAMVVDPSDDCTFWYVDQFQPVNGTFDWNTNIASFAFNSCTANPTFSLSANPNSLTITQGSNGTSTITVNPANGFNGSVTLSASGLPSGVTAAFNPNPTSTTSTLTLTASSSATTGTSTVTITGMSGSLTETTTISLTVNALVQSFSLSASPNTITIAKGGASATSNITINPMNGFSGNVTLAATGLPPGVTAVFNPNPATSASVLTLTASSTAKAETTTVTITGTSGSLKATTTITLTVTPLGGFTLTAAPKTLTIPQGSSGTSTITVNQNNGFDQLVTFSASGLPSGVAAMFNPNPATTTSVLTLQVSGSAAIGHSTVTITGVYGSLTRKTTVTLKVTAP